MALRCAMGWIWGLLSLLPLVAQAADPRVEDLEFFEKRIRPVLVQHCYECHSAQSQEVKGGLLLDSREGIRRGGDSGHGVVPGAPDGSLVLSALRYEGFEMPPEKPLPESVVADFEHWIRRGAADPRDGQALKIRRTIDFDEGRQFWAFQPPRRVVPPDVADTAWPRSEMDRFVLARLEQAGLRPVADAAPRVLARRLHFDLVGLPPDEATVSAFERDDSPEAVEELVDRLLASPQFGERWGRYWLDVARYAESNGRERNFFYPQAWRYRDYVIDAFNRDKPFDRFVQEQIAGDLLEPLPGQTRDELTVATGFLAIGPKSLNERNREVFRMDLVDEQIDATCRGFMALTVACARCHDHKFDPIPTREYYSIAGIFRSTDTLYGTRGGGNRQASKLIPLEMAPDAGGATGQDPARVQRLTEQLARVRQELKSLAAPAARPKRKRPLIVNVVPPPPGVGNPAPVKRVAPKQTAAQRRADLRDQANRLQAQLKGAAPQQVKSPRAGAMGVQEGPIEDARILVRGEVDNPSERVPRGFLTILSSGPAHQVASGESGRRELADWIASPRNPLTARVLVNRVWFHLFGSGLVASVDNFGATGEKPTHPELLDWLARRFVEDGWSVKRLVRAIVLSRTYQLGSDFDASNYEVDPDNQLRWRMSPRRLDAEALRDALLAAAGTLDLQPPRGSPVARYGDDQALGRGVNLAELDSSGRRRSVYLPIVRNAVPEALRLFDFAEPSILVGQRETTTVPAQALFLMNSPFVIEQSRQLARRLLDDSQSSDAERVQRLHLRLLGRPASGDEVHRVMQFVERVRRPSEAAGDDRQRRELAWAGVCQAMFACAEFRYLD